MGFKLLIALTIALLSSQALSKMNAAYTWGGFNTSEANMLRNSDFTHFFYSFAILCYTQSPSSASDCVQGSSGDQVYVTFNFENPYSTSMAEFWVNYAIVRSSKQVLFSVGGGGAPWNVVNNDPEASAQAIAKFVTLHKLSGVDLDFEGTPDQLSYENFGLFAKYLRQYMPQGSLLTIVPVYARQSGTGGGLDPQMAALQAQGVSPDYILLQFYCGGLGQYGGIYGYLKNYLTVANGGPAYNMSNIVTGYMPWTPINRVHWTNCNSTDNYAECAQTTCQINKEWPDNGGIFIWDYTILKKAFVSGVYWDQIIENAMNLNQNVCGSGFDEFEFDSEY